jgi:hypothetical protein
MVESPNFDVPIPGQAMTAELGSRPWQSPPQYPTVEEALDYYVPRMADDDFSDQLLDIMEMGVPLITLANTMQMSGVMEGKHSADVGILIMPVLVEMMRLIGDGANVKYTTGMEEDTKAPRSSMIARALNQLREEEAKEKEEEDNPPVDQMAMEPEAPIEEPMPQEEQADEQPMGLMARRS